MKAATKEREDIVKSGLLAVDGFDEEQPIANAVMIMAERLEPNPDQPRRSFDREEMDTLREGIRNLRAIGRGVEGSGILQPIIVRRPPGSLDENGNMKRTAKYQVVGGERRWRAGKEAGVALFPCVIQDMNNDEAFEAGLIENIHRNDLTPLEEGLAIRALMNAKGMTVREIADYLKKNRGWIFNRLGLLKYGEDVQKMLSKRADSIHAAREIDRVRDPKIRKQLIKDVVDGMSNIQLEQKIAALSEPWQKPQESGNEESHSEPEVPASRAPLSAIDEKPLGKYGTEKKVGVVTVAPFDIGAKLDFVLSQIRETESALSSSTIHKRHFKTKIVPKLQAIRELLDSMESTGSK